MSENHIKEEAPTNAVGDGSKVAGMSATDVGVKKKKNILTFKQLIQRNRNNNASSDKR